MKRDGINDENCSTLVLPDRYSGHRDFDGIKSLQAISPATVLSDTDEPNRKRLAYSPHHVVRLRYQVVQLRHGKISLGNHYQVILRENYFHFLGETFWIMPEMEPEKLIRVRLYWNHFPNDWALVNSFGVAEKVQSIQAAFWEFRHSIWAGGDFRIRDFRITMRDCSC